MSFNGTLKNNQQEIFYSFDSPRATGLAEMSNPALAKFRLCLHERCISKAFTTAEILWSALGER